MAHTCLVMMLPIITADKVPMIQKLVLLKLELPHMTLPLLHNFLTTHQPISIQIVITANKVV